MENKIFLSGTKRKAVFAVLVGPLAVVPALFLASFASYALNLRFEGWQNWRNMMLDDPVFASYLGLIISYAMTIIIGVPAMLLLKSLGIFNLFSLVIVGSLGAGILVLIDADIQFLSWTDFIDWLSFSYCSTAVCIGCWFAYKSMGSDSIDSSLRGE